MSHSGRSGPPDIEDTYSLLVLNITFGTTADDLYPLFDMYGKVVDVFIPRDSRTGDSRGFAFVRYKYADEAQKAVERLDGRNVDGRNIMVQFAKHGRNAERIMFGDSDSIDDILLPPSANNELAVGKFQPSLRLRTTKLVTASAVLSNSTLDCPTQLADLNHSEEVVHLPASGATDCANAFVIDHQHVNQPTTIHLDVSVLHATNEEVSVYNTPNDLFVVNMESVTISNNNSEMVIPSEMHFNQETTCATDELTTTPETSQASGVIFGLEDPDILLCQQRPVTDSRLGKFKPSVKKIPQPRERKAKSISFMLPGSPEAVPPIEGNKFSHQNNDMEVLRCSSMGLGFSFSQMMNEGFVDAVSQPSVANCNGDMQIGEDGASEVSSDQILSKPASAAETKCMEDHVLGLQENFLPSSVTDGICNSMQSNLSQEQVEHVACPDDDIVSQTIDEVSGADGYCGGEKSQVPSEEPTEMNVEDLMDEIFSGMSSSFTAKDDGGSKSSRKSRKRMKALNPFGEQDDTPSGDGDVDFSGISPTDKDHSDDEYMGDAAQKKRATRKSKAQSNVKEKPVQKRRKGSRESNSTVEKPEKKKVPLGIKRKRRQVDKVLLETPEHEIDLKQISMKNLILLAEAKEKISNKEAAALGKSAPNRRGPAYANYGQFDEDNNIFNEYEDGYEKDHYFQESSRKLNYHSYMDRTKSSRWTKSENKLFYQAIRQFGTDFEMIKQLFPNRTRHQVKLKFKNEERKNPMQVADAIAHRSKDHTHFELVIRQLQAQAEQDCREELDPTVDLEGVAVDEQARRETNKNEELNDSEGDIQDDPAKSNDWDGQAHSPARSSKVEDASDAENNEQTLEDILDDIFG